MADLIRTPRPVALRGGIAVRQKAPTAREIAYHHIRNEILSGRMAPRSRLAQDEIAEQLEISRIPIREAIVSLEAQGLIVHRANRGVYVRPISRSDIMSSYELRGYALAMAARRAIENGPGLARLVSELEATAVHMHAERDPSAFLVLSRSSDSSVAEVGAAPHLSLYLDGSLGYEPHDIYAWAPQLIPFALRAFDARLDALRIRDGDLAVATSIHHELEYAGCLADELAGRGILTEADSSADVT